MSCDAVYCHDNGVERIEFVLELDHLVRVCVEAGVWVMEVAVVVVVERLLLLLLLLLHVWIVVGVVVMRVESPVVMWTESSLLVFAAWMVWVHSPLLVITASVLLRSVVITVVILTVILSLFLLF